MGSEKEDSDGEERRAREQKANLMKGVDIVDLDISSEGSLRRGAKQEGKGIMERKL